MTLITDAYLIGLLETWNPAMPYEAGREVTSGT